MTLIQKMIATAGGIIGVGLVAITGLGGSQQAVNSVKTFMGLNPVSEQQLVPLPGTALNAAANAGSLGSDTQEDDEQQEESLDGAGGEKVVATVLSMVAGDDTVMLPDGRRLAQGSEAINLDDFTWD